MTYIPETGEYQCKVLCMDLILISLAERYDLDLDKLEDISRKKMESRGYASDLAVTV